MSKPILTPVSPGNLIYYSLDALTRPKKSVGFDEWGICEYGNLLWVGEKGSIEGKDILRVSLLDISDKRDERYPDWGDEELYVFAGFDESGGFRWFLLNAEEFKKGRDTVRQ